MTAIQPLRLAILGSGRGSNFLAIADAIDSGQLPATIVFVGSDNPDAPILQAARQRGLFTYACPPSAFKTKLEPHIEAELARALLQAQPDLIVLAGYMRVLKAPLLDTFPGRILNIHPSLLPAFPGLRAWEQALRAGVPETGCTVHWVDATIDGGPILDQINVPILPSDTPETLHARIQEAEHQLYPAVLARLALHLNSPASSPRPTTAPPAAASPDTLATLDPPPPPPPPTA
ncbi:MAG: phosphoribosylglycinamide formyltransferase [Verrucomicrobiia bacterium]